MFPRFHQHPHPPLPTIGFILIHLLILFLFASSLDSYGLGRKGPQKGNEHLEAEKALNRTLGKMQIDGEQGRFVLLICKTKCLRERAEIPTWIRDFNSLQNRSKSNRPIAAINENETTTTIVDDDPPLGFHFHFYKKPFPVVAIEKALKARKQSGGAIAFYVVGGRAFPMDGKIGTKEKFLKWLNSFENPTNILLLEDEEVDGWLNSGCHHGGAGQVPMRREDEQQLALLIVHDPEICPETFLKNLARSFLSRPNFVLLELRRPLTDADDFLLSWRLQTLSSNCRMDILLQGQHFLELPSGILGSELHAIVDNLTNTTTAFASANCSTSEAALSLGMQKIRLPLSPIELEFWKEERNLKAIEHNRQYLTVGAIGGVAVMALAISIFWGLNGNDFVPKQ